FSGNDLGAGADHDVHVTLNVRVARLADFPDPPVLQADIRLHDAPVIQNQRVGDHRIGAFGAGALTLPHAVANDLATAEFDLMAIAGEVFLDADPQVRVAKSHAITHGRAEHVCIGLSAERYHALSSPYCVRVGRSEIAHDVTPKAEYPAFTGQRDQFHGATLAGLETHGRARRN